MKIRPKLVLTFSLIFVIAFVSSSYIAHTTIESSLLTSGLSDEQAASTLEKVGTSIGIASAIIGIAAVLGMFWVSSRIAFPIRQLDSQLKSQRVGKLLRKIEIKRNPIDKDDEINVVIYTINSMINRLNELEEKKEELLAIITHEFKTPLSAMLGHSQVLLKPKIMGDLNPNQIKSIKIIDKNVSNLKKMIIDLLDVQKLNLEKMRFEYTFVDINKLIENLEISNQNVMNEKQIQFVNSTKEKISATSDRERLQQVFDHLILNAVDFVPKEGGKIEMGAQTRGDDVLFYVKDNGVGISSEKQKDLFKKLNQLDTSITRRHGGTRLGLSICKAIINSLGGKIWVESKPEKGAAFYFTISKLRKKVETVVTL